MSHKEINALQLTTARGFDQVFTQLISKGGITRKNAFYQLNELFEESTGFPRYSDYESYRVARSHRLKAQI